MVVLALCLPLLTWMLVWIEVRDQEQLIEIWNQHGSLHVGLDVPPTAQLPMKRTDTQERHLQNSIPC